MLGLSIANGQEGRDLNWAFIIFVLEPLTKSETSASFSEIVSGVTTKKSQPIEKKTIFGNSKDSIGAMVEHCEITNAWESLNANSGPTETIDECGRVCDNCGDIVII